MDKHPKKLLAEARRGGFFSYVAGVAYQVINNYSVGGLEINNYFTDLPIKKGLSSSAAICVLVARAFNLLYDLKLNIRSEMELAYQGEVTTPSRCGKMDQACAYAQQAIMMIFDGEKTDIIDIFCMILRSVIRTSLCALKFFRNTSYVMKGNTKDHP